MDRYHHIRASLGDELFQKVQSCKVLVIGAGGIGCELLKNLALSGFQNIETIDLDTIDVSNLNRQFLFRKHHVGKPKAQVAKHAAEAFNPDCNIVAHFGNVKSEEFGFKYFKTFDLVLNALDNVNARQHVNRICLGAKVPMIDAGTTGYLGQVTVISKGETECYDCEPKAENRKVFPICTIRNTPEKPVHCIVWGKELFKLLFGNMNDSMLSSALEDEDSSSQQGSEGSSDSAPMDEESKEAQTEMRSIIMQAVTRPEDETQYGSPEFLKQYAIGVFDAVFDSEIRLKLKMRDGYKGAKIKPLPLSYAQTQTDPALSSETASAAMEDQTVWSVKKSADVFVNCVARYWQEKRDTIGAAEFEKDDDTDLSFVTAASNIRSHVFGIEKKSKFDVKGIAGNIIHAIATTNAIVAGLQVLEAIKLLKRMIDVKEPSESQPLTVNSKFTWVVRQPVGSGYVIQPTTLRKPNPQCYSCGNSTVTVCVDTKAATLGFLVTKVVKGKFGFNEPEITMGASEVYLEGGGLEEEEKQAFQENLLRKLDVCCGGIKDGAMLEVEDFSQDISVKVIIQHKDNDVFEEEENAELFEVIGGMAPPPKPAAAAATEKTQGDGNADTTEGQVESDIEVMEVVAAPEAPNSKKRPAEGRPGEGDSAKRTKVLEVDDDGVICLD